MPLSFQLNPRQLNYFVLNRLHTIQIISTLYLLNRGGVSYTGDSILYVIITFQNAVDFGYLWLVIQFQWLRLGQGLCLRLRNELG